MMELNKLCASNIRKARREKDFTQEFMAFKLGISQKSYSDIENGKTKINVEVLNKIQQVLGVKECCVCGIINHLTKEGNIEEKLDDIISYIKGKDINTSI